MPPEFIVAIASLCAYTIAVWALGWHYGAKTLKDRNREFLAQMKKFNENRNPQSRYFIGYTEGWTSMLRAMERFLDRYKVEDDNGTP